MERYGKTPNVFKRDERGRVTGEWATEELGWLASLKWEFTEKIDGMNMRIIYFPPTHPEAVAGHSFVSIRGRGDNAQIPGDLLAYLADKHLEVHFDEIFPQCDVPVCVYGEGFGPGIQKGGHRYGPVKTFAGFDVKVGDIWLRRADAYDVISRLGLKCVPIVAYGDLQSGVDRVSLGLGSHYGRHYAEGLVARTPTGLLDRQGRRILCKIKHRDLYEREDNE